MTRLDRNLKNVKSFVLVQIAVRQKIISSMTGECFYLFSLHSHLEHLFCT
jgi:hypothetical protein